MRTISLSLPVYARVGAAATSVDFRFFRSLVRHSTGPLYASAIFWVLMLTASTIMLSSLGYEFKQQYDLGLDVDIDSTD